jgi:hypothetical protein
MSSSLCLWKKAVCNTHLVIRARETACFLIIRAPIRSINNTTLFTLLVDNSSTAFDDNAAVGAQ